ncbi:MAG: hypothetical protein AAGK23_00775 [Pseudomonadota bacterium]
MFLIVSSLLNLAVGLADPIEAALRATEAPNSLRVAFEVEIKSDSGFRIFAFDPRLPLEEQWTLVSEAGEDAFLDDLAATWGAEAAPDGRLFPDDLRASIGTDIAVEEIGPAWRLGFRHAPSANDGAFDVWAAERLDATAWLAPEAGRFLRIDYVLPRPVNGPEGGRLLRFDQSYFLETDPTYNVSLVTALTVKFEARGGLRTIRKSYTARTLRAEIFFATPEDEAAFLSEHG